MSQQESSKFILTEDSSCPGQTLEGNFNPYLKFITLEEWRWLDTVRDPNGLGPKFYKWHTPKDRVTIINEYDRILSKIDLHYIHDYYEQQLQKVREAKRQRMAKTNRYDLGAREFTFTYSPKWFNDQEARLQMSSAIQKICKYYKDEIIQLRAVGEVGTNGLSHIHCFYKLRGGLKISDKNFRRAFKMWNPRVKQGPTGHQGGHHANVRNEADFQGYIDKDIENSWFEVNIDNSQDPTN